MTTELTFTDFAVGLDEVTADGVTCFLSHLELHLQFSNLTQCVLLLLLQILDLVAKVLQLLLMGLTAD